MRECVERVRSEVDVAWYMRSEPARQPRPSIAKQAAVGARPSLRRFAADSRRKSRGTELAVTQTHRNARVCAMVCSDWRAARARSRSRTRAQLGGPWRQASAASSAGRRAGIASSSGSRAPRERRGGGVVDAKFSAASALSVCTGGEDLDVQRSGPQTDSIDQMAKSSSSPPGNDDRPSWPCSDGPRRA